LTVPSCTAALEISILDYLDVLMEAGEPLHAAQYAVASIIDALPLVSATSQLPRVKKALRGYRKAKPPRSRAPIGREIMAGIAQQLLAWGHPSIALLVVLQFFTYCRPGELRSAKRKQFIAPVRKKGPLSAWALSLAPQEANPKSLQAVTKTGVVDDTIVIDRPTWLAPIIEDKIKDLLDNDLVFPEDAATVVTLFKRAGAALGLPGLCMYQLRHGGASEDLLSADRTPHEVKARGRWTTDSSLRRYAKPAQIQRLLGSMDASATRPIARRLGTIWSYLYVRGVQRSPARRLDVSLPWTSSPTVSTHSSRLVVC
jgi:integrase